MRALLCLATFTMTLASITTTQASPRNWIDRYIAAHGHCRQPPVGYFTVVNPLEKPISEWTDRDLADLKAALDRCDALPEAESGGSRRWTGPLYESYLALVHEQQQRAAREEDAKASARDRADRIEAARQSQIAADKQAAVDRLAALRRATDNEVAQRKATEARIAAVAEEEKAVARLAEETEAQARAATAEAQARYGVEAAKRRAREAQDQADKADEQARADKQAEDRRFAEAHPQAYAPTPLQPQDATIAATTRENYVACKMLNGLVTASQAIAKGNGDIGAALVNAGECFLIDKGTNIRVKVADAKVADPEVSCVRIDGHPGCLWMPTSVLQEREH